ncbi:MAG: bifunctional 3,4-dihydroxy-2-butanone-4-phosphate synthase/GTP cyclohydrolase II [Cytophagaceae bacterium]|jgi:3,4-dihydroxy 2-butanone 4-phosphate synthase/GTP cyclohydrolase II|nr:bifunctional 3,4-dihydroxy-2-butanone-4-phosphate synthase/GTP cyclohydrolase II [Cytophagaceae bacterium]
MEPIQLDSIAEAIEDIRQGKVIIVVDDEDRENEGDLICAAETITPEIVNFMTKEARGLICVALTEERCNTLDLQLMVGKNTATHETAFTVSVDLLGHGCTTGISAHDRAKTIKALAEDSTRASDLGRPGHIFPLKAKSDGVLRRVGHTEATVDLARLAGFRPVGALVEIMNDDGSMARLPELRRMADKFNLKLISIKDLIEYRLNHESLVRQEIGVQMPTEWGSFELLAFRQIHTNELHLALIKGSWDKDEPIMVRVHSSCVTGDIFGSCRCDCGPQLHEAMRMIEKEGKGVILYMNQEGRGIGLLNKLRAYKLQEQGLDTVEANVSLGFKMDERDYGTGAQILRFLNVRNLRLISNNPVKRAALAGYGLEIVETIPIEISANPFNEKYLQTKRDKMGHTIMNNKDGN